MNFIPVENISGKINIEGVEFNVPETIPVGKLTVGIRAEKMIYGDKSIFVNTDITEMTGGEKIVYFELNGKKCSAKVPVEYSFDEKIELKISEKDMYFFDIEDGKNILYKAE